VTPQKAAGVIIEPEVSEPMLKATSPAATAAPGPEDEPPLQKSVFQGVRHAPVSDALASL
jgi:hypothetical protein